MKKLMIAAAIVCAAAVSQAVTVDWGFGNKVWVSEDGATSVKAQDYTGTVATGAKLCLFYLGQGVDAIDIAKIGADGSKYVLADSMDYKIKTGGSAATKGKWDPVSKTFDLKDYTDGASFGIVFYDGSQYDYVYAIDASGNLSDAYTAAATYNDLSGQTAYDAQYATGSGDTAGAIVNAVPEPTSGLLLLLGVAGLALRRRRA